MGLNYAKKAELEAQISAVEQEIKNHENAYRKTAAGNKRMPQEQYTKTRAELFQKRDGLERKMRYMMTHANETFTREGLLKEKSDIETRLRLTEDSVRRGSESEAMYKALARESDERLREIEWSRELFF